MMKFLLKLFVLLCIVGVALFYFAKPRIIEKMSENFGKSLQVKVGIGNIWCTLNEFVIESFEISNPRGFRLKNALTAQVIRAHAPLMGWIKKHVEVEELSIDHLYLGLEFFSPKGHEGNWNVLMNTAQTFKEKNNSFNNKSILIRKLILNDIQVDLIYQSDGKIRRLPPIKSIELYNIDSEGEGISDQLMHTALGKMIKEIFIQENLNDLLKQIFKLPTKGTPLPYVLEPFKRVWQ